MNRYYIHTSTGIKAEVYKWGNPVKLSWKHSPSTYVEVPQEDLRKFYMPITEADYESPLTLQEILEHNKKNATLEEMVQAGKALSSNEVGGTHYQHPIQPWDYIYILNELKSIYVSKNHDYGNSFEELFKECGLIYAYGHLKEKLNRIKALMSNKNQVKNESIEDSLLDLANYAILTLIQIRKNDGRNMEAC